MGLALAYAVAEVVGGLVSGSLALLADAGHMLSDVASLGLALFAARMARRPPTAELTYGYRRAEILAALVNGVVLVVVALYVFVEAWRRFKDPPSVAGPLMMGVAAGGMVVNLVGLLLLHGGREHSLNVRGAWLHVLGDAAGSVGALVAGALVWWRGWLLADPITSVLIGVLVLVGSWRLLSESVAILMEGTPAHLDLNEVRACVADLPGVADVHDLHIWTITTGHVSLSAHVVMDGTRSAHAVMRAVRERLHVDFDIRHSTIQVEPEGFTEPDTLV